MRIFDSKTILDFGTWYESYNALGDASGSPAGFGLRMPYLIGTDAYVILYLTHCLLDLLRSPPALVALVGLLSSWTLLDYFL